MTLVDGTTVGLKVKRIGRFWYRPIVTNGSKVVTMWLLDVGDDAAKLYLRKLNK